MKKETIEPSAMAIEKAREMQEKVIKLFNQVNNENKSILDIVYENLYSTHKWNDEQVNLIIVNLRKGIESYTKNIEYANESNDTLTLEVLNHALEGLSDADQKEKLITALFVLYYIQDTNADLTKLRNDWSVLSTDELKALIIEYTNRKDTYSTIINQLKEGLTALNFSTLNLPEQYGEMSNDYKLYVATQIFIEAENTDVNTLEGQAQAIGSSAAAAVDIVHETMRFENGDITEKTWHIVVKTILAALMFCLISLLFLFTSIDVFLNVLFLFTAIFGYGSISVLTGMILGYACVACVIYTIYEGMETMDDEIIEDIDFSLEQFFCKVDAWIAQVVKKVSELWEEVKTRGSEITNASQNNVSIPIEIVTEEEPIVNQPILVPVQNEN